MTEKLHVALVGTGAIAVSHARAIADAGLELIAVTSRTAVGAEKFIAEHLTHALEPVVPHTFDAVLDDPAVDLVVVATPTGTHAELAARVLRAGKHLLLEKPVDVDLERAHELARVTAGHPDLVAAVVSQHRFDPDAVRVADLLSDGRFGRVTSGAAVVPWWRSQTYYDRSPWRGTWAHDGGGALMNQGIHTLDLLLWFLGRPTKVHAFASTLAHQDVEVEDTLVATLEFASGALATVQATTAAYPGLATRIQVNGTRGSAVLERNRLAYLHIGADADEIPDYGLGGGGNQLSHDSLPASLDATQDASGHARQYADVARAIRTRTAPRVSVQDAVETLEVIDAVYRAVRTGRAVVLT